MIVKDIRLENPLPVTSDYHELIFISKLVLNDVRVCCEEMVKTA
jgi:hypothetical protein